MIANTFIGGGCLVALALVILNRTPSEEAMMIEKFGDEYHAYIRRTSLLLPRFVKGS